MSGSECAAMPGVLLKARGGKEEENVKLTNILSRLADKSTCLLSIACCLSEDLHVTVSQPVGWTAGISG